MKYLPFVFLLALVGCAGVSHSERGAQSSLAPSPAPVLYIPSPAHALLNAPDAALYAKDLADALGDFDVPSTAGKADTPSWQLIVAAAQNGTQIIPVYHVLGPNQEVYGKLQGESVPATGWAAGDQSLLAQTAVRDSRPLSKLLAQINAHVQLNSPDSLVNRPARVFVGTVSGIPDDENIPLPKDLSRELTDAGLQVVNKIADADFSIKGDVNTSPAASQQIIVQLSWIVHDSNNRLVGKVVQLHELKATELPAYWQQMAAATTSQAASGIKNVIKNDMVKKPNTTQAANK